MFSISDTLSRRLSESLSATRCSAHTLDMCRDDMSALALKFAAIGSILAAGVVGIAIPLIGSRRRSGCLSPDSNLFVAAKAFAAGVILATGFVHMLPDASANLTSPCLPIYPWRKFPFSGFLAMCSALVTLVVDFAGTQIFERKQGKEKRKGVMMGGDVVVGGLNSVSESGITPVDRVINRVDGSVNGGGMHIVGMYAHADRHGHNHPPNKGEGAVVDIEGCHQHHNHGEDDSEGDGGHGHGHSHGLGGDGGRHAVVSQVLELGIVSHSVIIGLSVGVSHSPCAIRPLIAALSFHQFFEGFALGGCISEARFKTFKTTLMACFFALTTPSGIGIGISIAKSYDSGSARALAIEGVLDSISAGILIYMSLVDLIAADFMSKKMRCNLRLQIVSYFALFSGAILMSSLAIWS